MVLRECTFLLLIFCSHISNVVSMVQDFYWRDYVPGDIPYDAFEGVPGRYIGQIHTDDSLTVATTHPYNDTAVSVTSKGLKKIVDKYIKILCAPDLSKFYWTNVNLNKTNSVQLKNAVRGGFEKDANLFIGKAMDEGEWKIGQVFPIEHRLRGLWVWKNAEGGASRHYTFDILKYNTTIVAQDGTVQYTID